MQEKIKKIKTHIKNNKKLYIGLGVSQSDISKFFNGKKAHAGGFTFENLGEAS